MSMAIEAFFADDESGLSQLIANNIKNVEYIKQIVNIDNYENWKEGEKYDVLGENIILKSGIVAPPILVMLYNTGILHGYINRKNVKKIKSALRKKKVAKKPGVRLKFAKEIGEQDDPMSMLRIIKEELRDKQDKIRDKYEQTIVKLDELNEKLQEHDEEQKKKILDEIAYYQRYAFNLSELLNIFKNQYDANGLLKDISGAQRALGAASLVESRNIGEWLSNGENLTKEPSSLPATELNTETVRLLTDIKEMFYMSLIMLRQLEVIKGVMSGKKSNEIVDVAEKFGKNLTLFTNRVNELPNKFDAVKNLFNLTDSEKSILSKIIKPIENQITVSDLFTYRDIYYRFSRYYNDNIRSSLALIHPNGWIAKGLSYDKIRSIAEFRDSFYNFMTLFDKVYTNEDMPNDIFIQIKNEATDLKETLFVNTKNTGLDEIRIEGRCPSKKLLLNIINNTTDVIEEEKYRIYKELNKAFNIFNVYYYNNIYPHLITREIESGEDSYIQHEGGAIPTEKGYMSITDPVVLQFFEALGRPPYLSFIRDYVFAYEDDKEEPDLDTAYGKRSNPNVRLEISTKFQEDLPKISMIIGETHFNNILGEYYLMGYQKGQTIDVTTLAELAATYYLPILIVLQLNFRKLLKAFADIDCKQETESESICPDLFSDLDFSQQRVIEFSSGDEWYYDKEKCDLYKIVNKEKKYYTDYYENKSGKCNGSYITQTDDSPACKTIIQCLANGDATSLNKCLEVISSFGDSDLFTLAEKEFAEIDPTIVRIVLEKFNFIKLGSDGRPYVKSYTEWVKEFFDENNKVSDESKKAFKKNIKLQRYLRGLIELVKHNPIIINHKSSINVGDETYSSADYSKSLKGRQYINPYKYAANKAHADMNALRLIRLQRSVVKPIGRMPFNAVLTNKSFTGGCKESPMYKDGSGSILKVVIARLENTLRSQGLVIDSKDKEKINKAIEFLIKTENQIGTIFNRMLMVSRHGMAIGLDRINYNKETIRSANFFMNNAITDIESARNFIKEQAKLLEEKYKALGEKQEKVLTGAFNIIPKYAAFLNA